MSVLNYVVIYHRNAQTSIHSFACWDQILAEYSNREEREIRIPNPFGGMAVIYRSDMESIHLVTEEEAEWNSQRHAAFEKLDRKHKEEWS